MACEQHMYQMPHFVSQDTSTEWRVIKIFYSFPLRSKLICVSPENQLPVCISCMLPRHVLLGHLDPWRLDWLVIPKYCNVVTTLCCTQSQNLFKTCSASVCSSIRRMQNGGIYIYICFVTLLQKMSNRVKSHVLPGQGIGLALSTQHCCSSFKSFFISKNHQTWGFHLLIPHKQNPHTEINQLAVNCQDTFTAWHRDVCGICTCSVRQTDFHGLHERFPCLVKNIHASSEHRSYCDSLEMRKIFQLHYGAVNQLPSQQMCKCLATGAIALCLHAVQQCGCKIILRERK